MTFLLGVLSEGKLAVLGLPFSGIFTGMPDGGLSEVGRPFFALFNEVFHGAASTIIGQLARRGLHEVGGRSPDGATDAAVFSDLGGAQSIDNDAGGVGGVPYFQLVFKVQRNLTEGGAFQADIGPLAVIQPGDVVGGANVNVAVGHLVGDDGGDGAGLGDLLGFEAVAFQHVHEVHVAAHVQLGGAVQANAAFLEEAGDNAVGDGGAHLGLDVVADDRYASVSELLGPLGVGGDKDGEGVDEGNTGVDGALGVELVSFFGAYGEVGDEDVSLGVFEDLDNIEGSSGDSSVTVR